MFPGSRGKLISDGARVEWLCIEAEKRLAAADIFGALASAVEATTLSSEFSDAGHGALFVRACIAEVDALNLQDRSESALGAAIKALRHAVEHCPGSRWEILARLKLAETYETLRRYQEARRQIVILLRALPDEKWCADLKMHAGNHALSIATHNADPFLGEFGRQLGRPLRPLVVDPNVVSEFQQWDGLELNRRGEFEDGCRLIRESLELRAENARRNATRSALEAELAFIEIDDDAGFAATKEARETLLKAGLPRHAGSLSRSLGRFLR